MTIGHLHSRPVMGMRFGASINGVDARFFTPAKAKLDQLTQPGYLRYDDINAILDNKPWGYFFKATEGPALNIAKGHISQTLSSLYKSTFPEVPKGAEYGVFIFGKNESRSLRDGFAMDTEMVRLAFLDNTGNVIQAGEYLMGNDQYRTPPQARAGDLTVAASKAQGLLQKFAEMKPVYR